MKTRKGFTLVEILIVVIILGILAAIVIPQFTNASEEARLSSLKSNLQSIRAQLQLYRMKNDAFPVAANFETLMTKDPNNGGATGAPFLYSIPTNPYNGLNTVTTWGSGGAGWEIDVDGASTGVAGSFRAGDGDAAHQVW